MKTPASQDRHFRVERSMNEPPDGGLFITEQVQAPIPLPGNHYFCGFFEGGFKRPSNVSIPLPESHYFRGFFEPWFKQGSNVSIPLPGNQHFYRGKSTVVSNDTIGRAQKFTIVSESGLYMLIMSSRKKKAADFQRWVTNEVLPSIRKNGGYISGQENLDIKVCAEMNLTMTEDWNGGG